MTAQKTQNQNKSTNWRRITRHPSLMEYRRLALLVFVVNVVVLWQGIDHGTWFSQGHFHLAPIADMALVNFTLAILIRQQRVVNILFLLVRCIPPAWPLWIRWGAGKVYHFGGLHVSGNLSGTLWLSLLFGGMIFNRAQGADVPSTMTLGISALILLLLVAIIVTAWSPIRAKYHNRFEKVHRFVGWSVLALFWAQTVSLRADSGLDFVNSPAFWVLCAITLSVISPWLTLKRVPIRVTKPSNHVAVVEFDYGDTPFAGSSNAISHTPFGEYHSFANIPTPGKSGYRLAISRSGDWTGRFIDNPPDKMWVKGITTGGVARIETLFSRVVYVATGSGIGPVLPHLLKKEVPSHLIWSTRTPRETYGDALVDEIEENTVDPIIWDTVAKGKPDLTALALDMLRKNDAEAVIVISNEKLTRKVVHDIESLGIPAYGAIWDS